MSLENLQQGITNIITDNPVASGVVGGVASGVILGAGAGLIAGRRKRKKRKSKSRKSSRRIQYRRRGTRRRRLKHRTSPRGKLRYHKGKHRGGKAIHYTKNGQPYRILASGKARFIKRRGRR